jgi:hypothetical protein
MAITRDLREGGFFRSCSRCGRRTFGLCEDCGRPTCPECATVERLRVGTSDRFHRMCPQCRFEYRSPDLLGTLEGVWTGLWLRIEVEDPAIEGAKGGAKLSPLPAGTGYPGTRAPTAERS